MTGWAHVALHGLSIALSALRDARAAGDLGSDEIDRLEAMLADIERLVMARGDGL